MKRAHGAVVLGACVAALALLYVFFFHDSFTVPKEKADWRFSTTQQWDPHLLITSEEVYRYPLPFDSIVLPPYPENLSAETRQELAYLADDSYRTPETLAAIQAEIKATGIQIGEHTFFEYFNHYLFPQTSVLLEDAYHDLYIAIMRQKKLHDRVRPSFLREDIAPVIDIPAHPSYPSGHATELHFMAYILGELDPENMEQYVARAQEVARHREIAGVHYPSDSQAGALLARAFVDMLMTDPLFKERLEKARKEWQ